MFVIASIEDSVAQLVARLTPDQKAACSSHVRVNVLFLLTDSEYIIKTWH